MEPKLARVNFTNHIGSVYTLTFATKEDAVRFLQSEEYVREEPAQMKWTHKHSEATADIWLFEPIKYPF